MSGGAKPKCRYFDALVTEATAVSQCDPFRSSPPVNEPVRWLSNALSKCGQRRSISNAKGKLEELQN